MTPETKAKKAIIAYLDSFGDRLWHVAFHNVGYSRKGIPDRLCVYRGLFFALEVKADATKEATPWQRREIAAIIDAGGIAEVVWDVSHVREIIARIDALLDREQAA